jgi:hypothetical protein
VQLACSLAEQSKVTDHSTNALFPSTMGVTRSVPRVIGYRSERITGLIGVETIEVREGQDRWPDLSSSMWLSATLATHTG